MGFILLVATVAVLAPWTFTRAGASQPSTARRHSVVTSVPQPTPTRTPAAPRPVTSTLGQFTSAQQRAALHAARHALAAAQSDRTLASSALALASSTAAALVTNRFVTLDGFAASKRRAHRVPATIALQLSAVTFLTAVVARTDHHVRTATQGLAALVIVTNQSAMARQITADLNATPTTVVTLHAHATARLAHAMTAQPPAAIAPVSLEGPPLVTATQLATWYRANGYVNRTGTPIRQVAEIYLEEGLAENIRGDIAFAQAVHESDGFAISSGANNYAGIGACSACGHGYSYPSLRMGVRAQIELLKAYADPHYTQATTARPAAYHGIDTLGVRGHVTTWQAMSGTWAPGSTYGESVLYIYRTMLRWALAHPDPTANSPAPSSTRTHPAAVTTATARLRHRHPAVTRSPARIATPVHSPTRVTRRSEAPSHFRRR